MVQTGTSSALTFLLVFALCNAQTFEGLWFLPDGSGIIIENPSKLSHFCCFTQNLDTFTHWIVTGDSTTFSGAGPTSRTKHAYTKVNDEWYVFGGEDLEGNYLNDLWKVDLSSGNAQWELLSDTNPVPARSGAGIAIFENELFITFGKNGEGLLRDTWKFDLDGLYWVRNYVFQVGPIPFAREGHASVAVNGNVWIWGGLTLFGWDNDLWRFHISSEKWFKVYQGENVPSPRTVIESTLFDEKLYIYGGQLAFGNLEAFKYWTPESGMIVQPTYGVFANDTWSLDFTLERWSYESCAIDGVTEPEECIFEYKPNCPNDCSGHGVCFFGEPEDQCFCYKGWNGSDCSTNSCAGNTPGGVDIDLFDRILALESLSRLGRGLLQLHQKLSHIQANLPDYADLISCEKWNTHISGPLLSATAVEGLRFSEECLSTSLVPVLEDYYNFIQHVEELTAIPPPS